jgi:hypothetical protein
LAASWVRQLSFAGGWRPYERVALAALERQVTAGARRTHVVAPPGEDRTLLGVEMIRRLGARALVLAPEGVAQARWPRAVREFTGDTATAAEIAGPAPTQPICCLSYAALLDIEDPAVAQERLEAAGRDPELAELLSADALRRVRALAAMEVATIVLDDCHRLASPWGPLVAAVLAALPSETHRIGLTATPATDVQDPLYDELVGPVDITIPVPAVVREGRLAPYQELSWLVEPAPAERAWLAEREGREVPERLPAERLLTRSAAKAAGMVEVVAGESAARGERLRAAVICDEEEAREGGDTSGPLAGVLDPASGTARHALAALADDARTAGMRPLLVSERGLFCVPADAEELLAAVVEVAEERFTLPEWAAEVDGVLMALRSSGAEWMPRVWRELATRVLGSASGVLVGTAAMLGEDWECPGLNCLVDLTVAASGPSAQQLRARTLGLDREDRAKLASNWEVVCAAPELSRGLADYLRFARRHAQLFAPGPDGAIEAGPAHAHPDLGAERPPGAARFAALNGETLARAADHAGARERWQLGTPYRGLELPTLLVRSLGADALPAEPAARAVAGAYAELGELGEAVVTVEAHGDGWVRCLLPGASRAEAERWVAALTELLGGAAAVSAFQVTRPVGGRLARALRRGDEGRRYAVPADLDRSPERAEAFARAWRRAFGGGRLVEAADVPAEPGGHDTAVRPVWV